MPANHRTLAGYAPLRVRDLIARAAAEQVAQRAGPRWPTVVDLGRACVRHFQAGDPRIRAARQDCAAAASYYHSSLHWTVVLNRARPTIALIMPREWAAIWIDSSVSPAVHRQLEETGLVGPVIGRPDGSQIHLVVCRHDHDERVELRSDPRVTHLPVGSAVHLPPSRDSDDGDAASVWLVRPERGVELPDCLRVLAAIHQATNDAPTRPELLP